MNIEKLLQRLAELKHDEARADAGEFSAGYIAAVDDIQNYIKRNSAQACTVCALLKSWSNGAIYETYEARATAAARRVYASLIIERGEHPRNAADFAGGLAYTSSSDFAALWCVNVQARKIGTTAQYFEGIAINTDGAPVAVYYTYDMDGNEAGDVYEIIKL